MPRPTPKPKPKRRRVPVINPARRVALLARFDAESWDATADEDRRLLSGDASDDTTFTPEDTPDEDEMPDEKVI